MLVLFSYTCAIYQKIQNPLYILVPKANTPLIHMSHMSVDTQTPQLYLCQMTGLHISTFVICQKIQRLLNYTFAKCQHFLIYTCPIYQLIDRTLSYNCAKCQHSSGSRVKYVGRYRDPLVILVPNAKTPQLHMRLMSADTKYTYICLFQMPALFCFTGAICQQIHNSLRYTCAKCQASSIIYVP